MAATATYAYSVRDRSGKIVTGQLEADSPTAVASKLRSMGYAPVSINEAKAGMKRDLSIPEQPPMTASADDLDRGDVLYHDICVFCHGGAVRSGGGIPDLRRMSQESHDTFLAIVLGGSKQANGMASFADLLTAEDAERIRQYIIHRANLDREAAMAADAEEPASG